jgi:predicted RNA-binding Zn ribbon-like protein
MATPLNAPSAPVDRPFKYIGGDPGLDLVNTVGWTPRGPEEDQLTDYARLIRWAQGAGILPNEAAASLLAKALRQPQEAARALRTGLQARAILHRVFAAVARGEPGRAPLAELNGLLSRALGRLQVAPPDAGRRRQPALRLAWRGLDENLEAPVWPAVWSAASLIVSEEASQLRICGGEDCGWMYVDRSRNGLRRWCDMATCGTIEKTRRRLERARRAGRRPRQH